MTECRAPADTINPAQIQSPDALYQALTPEPFTRIAVSMTSGSNQLFDLHVMDMDSDEWACTTPFVASLPEQTRQEVQRVVSDLQTADTDGDRFVTNGEVVEFLRANPGRWENATIFRTAADHVLNILPNYLAQPRLSQRDVSDLWGILNEYARLWDEGGAPRENRGTLYGISLEGFPSSDPTHPPNFISRAAANQLNPEELAAVHLLLSETQTNDNGTITFQGSAPLTPNEMGLLSTVLNGASASGATFHGMRIVSGDEEARLFAAQNEAVGQCRQGMARAVIADDPAGLATAFGSCNTAMAPFESANAGVISATALLSMAYMGLLSPTEVHEVRSWMREQGIAQGILPPDGTMGQIAFGFRGVFRDIANRPWHHLARNGAFITGAILYHRLLLRNLFTRRMNQFCPGGLNDPGTAFRQYEAFARTQSLGSGIGGFLGSLPRRVLGNWAVGLLIFNFVLAPRKDTGNLGVDILTDMPLIPLFFEAFQTYDVFRTSVMSNFAAQNPGICRSTTEPANVPTPAEVSSEAAVCHDTSEAAQYSALPWEEFYYTPAPAYTTEPVTVVPPAPAVDLALAQVWGDLDASRAVFGTAEAAPAMGAVLYGGTAPSAMPIVIPGQPVIIPEALPFRLPVFEMPAIFQPMPRLVPVRVVAPRPVFAVP